MQMISQNTSALLALLAVVGCLLQCTSAAPAPAADAKAEAKAEAEPEVVSLEKVLKDEKYEIKSIKGATKMVQEALAAPEALGENKQAFEELAKVLERLSQDHGCTRKTVDLFRRFHRMVVSKRGNKKPCPTALKRFFQALVFETSSMCQSRLVKYLDKAVADAKIDEADFKAIQAVDPYTKGGFAEVKRYQDVVLVHEATTLRKIVDGNPRGEPIGAKPIVVVDEAKRALDLVKLCNDKMSPVYKQLLLPIMSMASLGYDYQREGSPPEQLKGLTSDERITRWYGIAYRCNFVRSARIFVDKKAAGKPTFIVKYVTKEQRDKMATEMEPVEVPAALKTTTVKNTVPRGRVKDAIWLTGARLDAILAKNKPETSENARIMRNLRRRSAVELAAFKGAPDTKSVDVPEHPDAKAPKQA